ncbi:inositol monophosphatase [Geovibrio thiophilus]|uniref:Inositol-1-monophosphatase n=1 Tax=Geovibrio thiophilus TaxID=139438 RepID=A0A3R6AY42_9BACT|nr:inositol monophosphatase family protein [Geovibrio thiophilus]QAR33215.1 inositol monophosphatase [Geovibrio thiophilus]
MEELIKAALEAGEIIKDGFKKTKDVKYKGSIDLVTEYDVAVENFLKKKLSPLFPEHVIIGEESSTGREEPEKAIYIDPIDGTTNFVHSFPFVSVSIGFYENGEAVRGLVYNPVMDEMFCAEKGAGAFLNNERIRVSETQETKKSLIATGFPYSIVESRCPDVLSMLGKVLSNTRGIRRAGSAALDLCYTAKGTFDCYYEFNLKPWDVAGGICVVQEAGGQVSGLDGKKHRITGDFIIASNGIVHEDMLGLIKC